MQIGPSVCHARSKGTDWLKFLREPKTRKMFFFASTGSRSTRLRRGLNVDPQDETPNLIILRLLASVHWHRKICLTGLVVHLNAHRLGCLVTAL